MAARGSIYSSIPVSPISMLLFSSAQSLAGCMIWNVRLEACSEVGEEKRETLSLPPPLLRRKKTWHTGIFFRKEKCDITHSSWLEQSSLYFTKEDTCRAAPGDSFARARPML
ncbi:hypothetical protein NDU88_004259 [Pleurodeles waltl]|uniref:Secreted protein n=1 Tax=Pleurodeles waltl TaxID=8319 RepID=A0AAV7VFS5_PLEWA|nr:hypothetical protein NDU88_004259 [Pleurodeles waltl]